MESFESFLSGRGNISEFHRPHYLRWVQMYEDFLKREGGKTTNPEMSERFACLLENRYEPWKVKQARHAVQLYSFYHSRHDAPRDVSAPVSSLTAPPDWKSAATTVVSLMRMRHYSLRTEKAYLSWIRRFSSYVQEPKPAALTDEKLRGFLSYLAVEQKVAAATQKLAFNALLFLYRNVLGVEIKGLASVVPSHIPKRLPVVLTIEEVKKVLSCMNGTGQLMATMIYGGGLRLQECLSLRIKDLDFTRNCLTIRGGKGDKDRQTVLPEKVCNALRRHLENAREVFDKDRKENVAGVVLPGALERKFPSASTEWGWFWVFPSSNLSVDPQSRVVRRFHTYPSTLQRAFRLVELRHHQTCNHSYTQAQLRYSPYREGIRYSNDPGVAGPF
jgi:integron integrase